MIPAAPVLSFCTEPRVLWMSSGKKVPSIAATIADVFVIPNHTTRSGIQMTPGSGREGLSKRQNKTANLWSALDSPRQQQRWRQAQRDCADHSPQRYCGATQELTEMSKKG